MATTRRFSAAGLAAALAFATLGLTFSSVSAHAAPGDTVPPKLITSVVLFPDAADLVVGQSLPMQVTYSPPDATVVAFVWFSSDDRVVQVTPDGIAHAVGPGTAIITASAVDGSPELGWAAGSATITVTGTPIPVTSVTVSPATANLVVGGTQYLRFTVAPSDATWPAITWSSSDTSVATISAGIVTAVSPGTAIMTATAVDGSGVSGSATITVTPPAPTLVTSVTVNPTAASIIVGGTQVLTASVAPSNAAQRAVTWSSSASSVATVTQDGTVTAVAPGTATITATAVDGSGKAGSATITVTPPAPTLVTSVTVNPTTASITLGGSQDLAVTVAPADATQQDVTWASSNTTVATVTQDGTVTGVAPGSATITATAVDGSGVTGSTTVTVTAALTLVTSVTVNPATANIVVGETQNLTASVAPSDATDPGITWSSSDTSVATVTQDGTVTAVSPGTAVITAAAVDTSRVTGSTTITVTAPAPTPVTSVTVNPAATSIIVGETQALTVTVTPADATQQDVAWTSSNTSIATVTQDGTVTGVAPGSATVTATAVDGSGVTGVTTITVTAPAPALQAVAPEVVVANGQEVDAYATGFEPGESVVVTVHSITYVVGTFTANQQGRVDVSWAIPKNFPPGAHTIEFAGALSGTVSVPFTVTSLIADTGGSLVGTGSANPLSPGVLMLILGLGTLAVWARREARESAKQR